MFILNIFSEVIPTNTCKIPHMVSNIEEGNNTFILKWATSQTDGIEFWGAIRNDIGAHGNEKYWTLGINR